MREFRPVFVRRPVPRCGGCELLIRASYSVQTIVCSGPARLVYVSSVRHDAFLSTRSGSLYNEISLLPYAVVAVRTTLSVSCHPLQLLSIVSIVVCCRVLWSSFRTSYVAVAVIPHQTVGLIIHLPRRRIAVRWYHESRRQCNQPHGRINLLLLLSILLLRFINSDCLYQA